MIINKILFSIIGFLFVAILGTGIFAFSNRSAVSNDTPTPVVQDTNPAQVDTTQTPTKGAGEYTLAEVAKHNSASSCYTAVNGSVYDLTRFIDQHPGGVQAIESLCGIDGTTAFLAQHGGQRRPENELASLKIGTLVK
ncbi:MAG: cytochrome b5-like heme/steroid binding domain-containing protein [Patescibacteria group bacterium]